MEGELDDGGFAQTRGEDSLFEDEIVRYDPGTTPAQDAPWEEPLQKDTLPLPPIQPVTSRGGRGARRPYGVRGGRPGRSAEVATTATPPAPSGTPDEVQAPQNAPQGPKAQAVRGDRSGTGGVSKQRLTAEELAEKMERMKLKSTELSKAHAAAEADKASADRREKVAQEKRRAEKQNHQQMENERSQNRQRKMKAMGGREWDAEKEKTQDEWEKPKLSERAYNEAYQDLRGQAWDNWLDEKEAYTFPDGITVHVVRRSFYTGHPAFRLDQFYDQRKAILAGQDPEQHSQAHFRGRAPRGGGRGRGAGRGRGRGNNQNSNESLARPTSTAAVPSGEDFPALPGGSLAQSRHAAKKPSNEPELEEGPKTPDVLSPAAEGTWADQMESTEQSKTIPAT